MPLNVGAPHRQHCVSKVILKQFTLNGELLSIDLRYGKSRPRSPTQVGWFFDLVRFDRQSAEQLWREVENRLNSAIANVKSGVVHEHAESSLALREAVALHYMRSSTVRLQWDAMVKSRVAEIPRTALQLGVPAEQLRRIQDQLRQEVLAEEAEWFQENLTDNYSKALKLAAGAKLEVFETTGADFVISDNPVLSSRSSRIVARLPFSEADSHTLPISPRFAVALSTKTRTSILSSEEVRRINTEQVRQAHSHVFVHPESDIEGFVLAARAAALDVERPR